MIDSFIVAFMKVFFAPDEASFFFPVLQNNSLSAQFNSAAGADAQGHCPSGQRV